MTKKMEFLFDVGSPTAYLAWTQLPAIAERTGAQLELKPILLGGVFKATGNAPPGAVPAKGMYMMRDLARYAARYQVPLTMNPHFPVNTITPMRVITAALGTDQAVPVVDALFDAMATLQIVETDEVVCTMKRARRLCLLEKAASDVEEQLKANTEAAVKARIRCADPVRGQ